MKKRINVDEVVETNENILVELLELDDLINNFKDTTNLLLEKIVFEDLCEDVIMKLLFGYSDLFP